MLNFKPCTDFQPGLVLALDFGTTCSGIAYAFLDFGRVPEIKSVTQFPGQENGAFKTPSVICYKSDGSIRAIGAEARQSTVDDDDYDVVNQDYYVEWFKLYLAPRAMYGSSELRLPALPPGKEPVSAIADYLAYLLRCARKHIEDMHADGTRLWQNVQGNIDFVLGHPNGWEGSQQAKMRQAALLANLVPNDAASHAKIHFVSEGEASLHYCVNNGFASAHIKDGSNVMIVDCGGGTVDLSTYRLVAADPLVAEETTSPISILQGSTRINTRFYKFLEAMLRNSKFSKNADLLAMMDSFEKSTKPTFKDPNATAPMRFGGLRDNDPDFGIRHGQINIDGKDIEHAFKPSLDAIVDAVRSQKKASDVPIAFLVGGFAASPWLYSQLRTILKGEGIDLSRPDDHTVKAVSQGAVSFFLKKFVTSRIARITYGVSMNTPWAPNDPQHVKRAKRLFYLPSGQPYLPDAFRVYISKGDKLDTEAVIRYPFFRESRDRTLLDKFTCEIKAYRGSQLSPCWIDEDPCSYSTLCSVDVDTSNIRKKPKQGPSGTYYRLDFDIVLKVGLIELQAQVTWKDKGVDRWSTAELIFYDE